MPTLMRNTNGFLCLEFRPDAEPLQVSHRLKRALSLDGFLQETRREATVVCTTAEFHARFQSSFNPPVREADEGTKLMLQNIACRYTKADVMDILDALGFNGTYDSVYVPERPYGKRSKKGKYSSLGYAFVNFLDAKSASECKRQVSGKTFGWSTTAKLCVVSMAKDQGANSFHYHAVNKV